MTANKTFLKLIAIGIIATCSTSLDAQGSRIENEFFPREHNARPAFAIADSVRIAQGIAPRNSPGARTPFSHGANQPIKSIATNLKGFGVPFSINAANSAFIEVQLYLSRDQGKSWKFQARQSTDAKDFPFQAPEDGEYWFALKTLNHDRKLLPEGIPQPELKIIVDTIKPTFDFRIETDAAGRVICRWRAEDNNLAPDSLKIFYQPVTITGTAREWIQVPVNLGGIARGGIYADQLAWWPETTEQSLNVAVEIRDIADNVVQLKRQVVVPQTAWRKRSHSTAQITDATQPRTATLNNPWTNTNPLSTNATPSASHTKPITVAKAEMAKYPPNVVCKDGVCKIIPAPQRVARKIDPTIIQSGTSNGAGTPQRLIGSPAEFVDPPPPDGAMRNEYESASVTQPAPQQQTRVAQVPTEAIRSNQNSNSGSVAWPSETESWGPKSSSSSSTTRQPDSSITPHPFPQQPIRKPVTNVPGNPPTTSMQGDQIVSQSSTMGPANQYRGLNSQGNRRIPSPELLPRIPAEASGAEPGFRSVGTGTQSANQPGRVNSGQWQSSQIGRQNSAATQNTSSRSDFLSAGFANKAGANRPTGQSQSPELPNRDTRAPSQIIGTKRFRLNYGIDSIDPSGVARVDLWMSRDDGRTWNAWGSDPDNQSPFPVEIQEEGRYGFRIVVHSKDGLTGQGPSSGDDADMWILVDTQPPLTRITSVPYGRGSEAGRLVINYSVSDDFLTLRPITLGYSANPDGPWNIIEDGVRNEDRYVWKVQPNVPNRVFLRIEAIDKAGNVGVHVLSQSIDVSGLVPRGTIHGVVPVGTGR